MIQEKAFVEDVLSTNNAYKRLIMSTGEFVYLYK